MSLEKKNQNDEKIYDNDLRKKLYPIDVLIKNVEHLSLSTLLRWQKLDANFCKKYILNEEYQSVEDKYKITYEYILKKQPHLSYEDLVN